jgi:hypothetical protein
VRTQIQVRHSRQCGQSKELCAHKYRCDTATSVVRARNCAHTNTGATQPPVWSEQGTVRTQIQVRRAPTKNNIPVVANVISPTIPPFFGVNPSIARSVRNILSEGKQF